MKQLKTKQPLFLGTDMRDAILRRAIIEEKKRTAYIYNEEDEILCRGFLVQFYQAEFQLKYMAQLERFDIPCTAQIVARYIESFTSPVTVSHLLPYLFWDKEDRSDMILKLFGNFREKWFTQTVNPKEAAVIYRRFDLALAKLSPDVLIGSFLPDVIESREVLFLPKTLSHMARAYPIAFQSTLIGCLENRIPEDSVSLPPIEPNRIRELRLIAMRLLTNSASDRAACAMIACANDPDPFIRSAAEIYIPDVNRRLQWRARKRKSLEKMRVEKTKEKSGL